MPTSLSIDNTVELSSGVYQLTFLVNGETKIVTVDKDDNWFAHGYFFNGKKIPITAAIMFGLMLAEIQSPMAYWIYTPIFNNWVIDDINYQVTPLVYTGMAAGVSNAEPNQLKIVPSTTTNAIDLYGHLSSNAQSLQISSCRVMRVILS